MSSAKKQILKDPKFTYDSIRKLAIKNYGSFAHRIDKQYGDKKYNEVLEKIRSELEIIYHVLRRIPRLQKELRFNYIYEDIIGYLVGIIEEFGDVSWPSGWMTDLEIFVYETLSLEKVIQSKKRSSIRYGNSYFCVPMKGYGKGRWRNMYDMQYFIIWRIKELVLSRPTLFYKNNRRIKKVTKIKLTDTQIKKIKEFQDKHRISDFDKATLLQYMEEIGRDLENNTKAIHKELEEGVLWQKKTS